MNEGVNRRDFLFGASLAGAGLALAGCATGRGAGGAPGSMSGFAAAPIRRLRVGVVGLGMRGTGWVGGFASIPGVEVVALCDLYADRVERAQKQQLDAKKLPRAKLEFSGEEGWKKLCESDLDLVVNATPWALHAPIALYAMEHGKHVAIEVPSAMTLDECWALVETSERTRRHCLQMENCCYGEAEMMSLNLVRQGVLGEIMHAEGAYIHDLRELQYMKPEDGGYQGWWRLKWNMTHKGNPYPTHGLVPVMQAMNVNRGDRLGYLSCIQCDQRSLDLYAEKKFGKGVGLAKMHPVCGDQSTTIIRTALGRTIMVQHDVNSPRPYSRHNLVQGTKGVFRGINFVAKPEDFIKQDNPVQFTWEDEKGEGTHEWFDFAKTQAMREKYKHPLWRQMGEHALKMGGHGGMDTMLALRLCYCLQQGLPLDMDVYDLAASCALCELSDISCRNRGESVDIPDFTRGGWKTAKPLGIVTVDMSGMGA